MPQSDCDRSSLDISNVVPHDAPDDSRTPHPDAQRTMGRVGPYGATLLADKVASYSGPHVRHHIERKRSVATTFYERWPHLTTDIMSAMRTISGDSADGPLIPGMLLRSVIQAFDQGH